MQKPTLCLKPMTGNDGRPPKKTPPLKLFPCFHNLNRSSPGSSRWPRRHTESGLVAVVLCATKSCALNRAFSKPSVVLPHLQEIIQFKTAGGKVKRCELTLHWPEEMKFCTTARNRQTAERAAAALACMKLKVRPVMFGGGRGDNLYLHIHV